MIFATLCESKISPEKAYRLLEEMKQKFYDKFSQKEIDLAVAYGLEFNGILKELMVIWDRINITVPN